MCTAVWSRENEKFLWYCLFRRDLLVLLRRFVLLDLYTKTISKYYSNLIVWLTEKSGNVSSIVRISIKVELRENTDLSKNGTNVHMLKQNNSTYHTKTD